MLTPWKAWPAKLSISSQILAEGTGVGIPEKCEEFVTMTYFCEQPK